MTIKEYTDLIANLTIQDFLILYFIVYVGSSTVSRIFDIDLGSPGGIKLSRKTLTGFLVVFLFGFLSQGTTYIFGERGFAEHLSLATGLLVLVIYALKKLHDIFWKLIWYLRMTYVAWRNHIFTQCPALDFSKISFKKINANSSEATHAMKKHLDSLAVDMAVNIVLISHFFTHTMNEVGVVLLLLAGVHILSSRTNTSIYDNLRGVRGRSHKFINSESSS